MNEKIPDEQKRKSHILKKQLYMGEINKKNCYIIRQIFYINNEYEINLFEGDTLSLDIYKTFKIKKFDIIIGNPPYNKEVKIHNVSLPLYNEFVEYYVDKCYMLSYIVPSRWFSGGKGLNKFRKDMLKRKDIVYIKHYDDAKQIFGNNVDIKGGVNYFLIDNKYEGMCTYNEKQIMLSNFDIMSDIKYYDIVNKLLKYENITLLYNSQDHYKIQSNDKRLVEITDDNIENKYIVCYVSKQKGFKKYIDKKEIKNNYEYWKVLTTSASHSANSGFGNIFIGNNMEVHCKTYISFNVKNEDEAKSLLSYMKCKLPNFMLSLRKSSHNLSCDTCKWIPLVPLDRIWNDKEIYKYLKLSKDEIELVFETNVFGYE